MFNVFRYGERNRKYVSLWGTFGKIQNLTQTEHASDVKRWYELLLDDTIEISQC